MSNDHLIPNTTQVPNAIMDLLMPFLHDGESRVLLYLCRRTYGFGRESDSISLDQFTNGIQGEDQQWDFGAGVSRRAAITALTVLKEIGIVEQLEGGQGRGRIPVYHLNRKCEMMQWLHLIAQDPKNAREIIVQKLHLIREKHASVAPINSKPKKHKEPNDKVQNMHLSEKVQDTTVKGANEFSENRADGGLDAPTKPSTTKPRKTDTPPTPSPSSVDVRFDWFWKAYPRKEAKGRALKVWKRLKPTAELSEIMLAAVARQRASPQWKREQGKFIPHAATWLNDQRWEDENPEELDTHERKPISHDEVEL